MKWGSKKKKPPPSTLPSSSSRPSLISHVFPISWLSRFKQKSGNSEPKPSKIKPKGKRNSPSMGSPRCASSGGGRFYGLDDDDDDGFWRLSFGEDSAEGKKKNGGAVRSVRYDSDDEFEVRPSSCRNCQTSATKMEAREGSQNTKDMHKSGNAKDWKLRKEDGGVSGKKWLELEREAEEAEERSTEREYRAVLEMLAARTDWTTERDKHRLNASDTRKHHHVSSFYSRNSGLKTIEEEVLNLETEEVSAEKRTPDWQKLKERKIEELKSKSEKHRKSLYISRELQRRKTKRSNKVRVCSPRTASRVEICKIKALQDMTKAKVRVCSPRTASRVEICKIKAKLKTKKLTKEERTVQQIRTGLDSFAVVKCSFDPHQDFRDSMVEMIEEKKITQPEDLEELLACYLTLNSDEYHDLIIKVFRQVWFDLNQTCFGTEIHSKQGCND